MKGICGLFSALIFLGGTARSPAQLSTQAPGWSRGQQQLAISYEECRRRAPQALQDEGYRIDYNSGAFSVGIRDAHTAIIMCNPSPEAKTWINIVVASNSPGGGDQRQRLQARMEGASPGVVQPPPPPPPSNCSAFGTWKQTTADVGTSDWEIGSNGQATEQSSRIVAPVTISGRTIRISWTAPSGYAGIYEWTLDDACTTGSGSLTFTRGGSGSHKSTIRRTSGAQQSVISSGGKTGMFNATPGMCPMTGRWTHNTESIGTTSWEVASGGQATEYGGSATGTAALTARTLQITWAAPSGYAGYYQWTLDATCNAGSGTLMFTKGGSGTFKSTVKRN